MEAFPVTIERATMAHIPACLDILQDSVLGDYFDPEMAREILTVALAKDQLKVALQGGATLAFRVLDPRASFLVFPYVHLLAVRADSRSQGIGGRLLDELEAAMLAAPGYPFRPKIFLLVAQNNRDAVRFYERHGYVQKAVIDDMFTEGDTEFLMMKDLGPKPGHG
jgi:ribosomal protein S18 acetylase RimI-like enzyme